MRSFARGKPEHTMTFTEKCATQRAEANKSPQMGGVQRTLLTRTLTPKIVSVNVRYQAVFEGCNVPRAGT